MEGATGIKWDHSSEVHFAVAPRGRHVGGGGQVIAPPRKFILTCVLEFTNLGYSGRTQRSVCAALYASVMTLVFLNSSLASMNQYSRAASTRSLAGGLFGCGIAHAAAPSPKIKPRMGTKSREKRPQAKTRKCSAQSTRTMSKPNFTR